MTQALLTPFKLGPIELPSRIVMAPLTRMRSLPGNVPGPLNATYYGQRASMGLVITEAAIIARRNRVSGSARYPFSRTGGWLEVDHFSDP